MRRKMGRPYRQAFGKALKDYCKETSVVGFQYLIGSKRTWVERVAWWLLLLFLFIGSGTMIFYNVNDFFEDPLVTSLETHGYSIRNIEFPAVSICNINKISNKRAVDFAQLLSTRANDPFDWMLDGVKILGNIYDSEVYNENDFLTFQTYLENYGVVDDSWGNNYMYYIMKNLSTPCDELLYRCVWKRQRRNCSELFLMRRTYEGFCCTFNYVRTSSIDARLQSEPEILDLSGSSEGLIVTIQNDPEDYFYPLVSSKGVNVQIFDPYDYPDVASGGLIQELVGLGTETFLDLRAKTIYSDPEVRKYPISTRQCIFDHEVETAFGLYSYSNCLMQCRVESILALCQCVPLMIPWSRNATVCNLPDIVCLNKYEDKWQSLYPRGFDSDQLDHEKQNSLSCPHCYDSCSSTSFDVSSNFAFLNLLGPEKQQYENFSVIRVYYGNPYSMLYKQDVIFYWYEQLSIIGGLLGIFLGVSIVSITELVYFLIFRFILILKRS